MTSALTTSTLAAAANAGIVIIRAKVEEFYPAKGGTEHMVRVDFLWGGCKFSALEYYDRKSGMLCTLDCYMDAKGIYDEALGKLIHLFWSGMRPSEYDAHELVRLAILAAMKDAIRDSRRRPAKKAA